MLTQIAKVLGRQGQSRFVPEPLPPFHWPLAQLDDVRLVGQFIDELKKVGGEPVRLNSEVDVKRHLESLLPASLEAPVAVSDGHALARLGVREWLAGKGRRIVPPLKEFVASQNPNGEAVSSLVERYKAHLMEASVGITTADFALADTGTVVIVSGNEQHRLISLLPPTHICLLDSACIFPSLTNLLVHLHDRFSESLPKNVTCITGPSRTADIEQTITMGVHGPKSLHVIVY